MSPQLIRSSDAGGEKKGALGRERHSRRERREGARREGSWSLCRPRGARRRNERPGILILHSDVHVLLILHSDVHLLLILHSDVHVLLILHSDAHLLLILRSDA